MKVLNNDGEIEHLVDYFDRKDICGEYTLYIKNSILEAGTGISLLDKIYNLFDEYLVSTDVSIDFELIKNNEKVDTYYATIYRIVVANN